MNRQGNSRRRGAQKKDRIPAQSNKINRQLNQIEQAVKAMTLTKGTVAPKGKRRMQRAIRNKVQPRQKGLGSGLPALSPTERIMSTGMRPVVGNYSRRQKLPLHQSQDVITAKDIKKYMPHVHECDANFILARTNPWGTFVEPPCNPVRMAVDSFKFRTRWVGTFQCGVDGSGFISVNAWNPYTGYPMAPSLPFHSIAHSTGTYSAPSGTYQIGQLVAGSINYQDWLDTPLSGNDALNGSFKVVGCAVKICDIGRLNETSGKICKWTAPSKKNPWYTVNISQAQILQTSRTENVSVEKCYFNCYSSNAVEDDDILRQADVQDVNANGSHFGFLIQGAEPGRTFNAEACAWFEYIPSSDTYNPAIGGLQPTRFSSLTTKSHVTPNGADAAAAAKASNEAHLTTEKEPAKLAVEDHSKNVLEKTVDDIGGAVQALTKGDLGGVLKAGATAVEDASGIMALFA